MLQRYDITKKYHQFFCWIRIITIFAENVHLISGDADKMLSYAY